MTEEAISLGSDCIIDGEKYAVYQEVVKGAAEIAFNRQADIPLSRTKKGAIPVLYEDGLSGGMGYGRAVQGGPGDAYAHSVGFDNHLPGLMRLHGRRIIKSMTENYTPAVDVKTDFFEMPLPGTAAFSAFTFVKDTDNGAQAGITHGLSVVPVAFIFWTAGQTASGTVAAGVSGCIGFSDLTTERATAWSSEDNVGTSNAGSRFSTKAISLIDPDLALLGEATVSAVTSTTFDLTWTDNGSSTASIMHGIAIGGPDVSAAVDEWAHPGIESDRAITVGFKPDACIHISASLASSDSSTAGSRCSIGVMDGSGNQWFNEIRAADGQDTTSTLSTGSEAFCANNFTTFTSMDESGFTVHTLGGFSELTATLSLKGLRVKAGNFTKKTTATTEAAQAIGFTTTAFLLSSVLSTTDQPGTQEGAALAIGAASATDEVEASAWLDQDNVGTSDVYGLDDTALAFEEIDDTGAELATATCADIDMETAGWLTWGVNTGAAVNIYFLGFAALASSSSAIYGSNSQTTTKMTIASNVITVQEQTQHGGDASCGFGTTFEDIRWQPLGKIANAVKLTAVTVTTGDTWGDAGHTAVAYCNQQDGPTAKLAKGYSASAAAAANLVALSSDGSSFAGGWEIGDLTAEIIRMVDTGTSFYVGKQDNLYRADPTSIADKITANPPHPHPGDAHGAGLTAAPGTDACFYNHGPNEWFFTGGQRPADIGIDTNPFNQPIENITHEPVNGEYHEGVLGGDWKYNLYRVTESSTTKTYVLASHWIRGLGRWIPHSYDRLDGWARGAFIDNEFRLWIAFNGDYMYYQLGKDYSPDAGRNNIGYGAASTTYRNYLPEIDAGLEVTKKRLWQFFILTRNIDATCPVQLIVHRDEDVEEDVGPAIVTSGLSKRHWINGTKDTATRLRLGMKITTTATYDPASSDPQVLVFGVRVFSEPDVAGAYDITIDTGAAYEGDEPAQEAKDQRDALLALVNNDAVVVTDPQGNELVLRFLDVSDLQVQGPNEDGKVHYVLRCQAEERVSS